MFCVKCGIIIKEGQKFCTNCGAPVYKTTVNANQNDVSDKESEEKSKDVQNRDSIQFEDFKKQSAEYLNEKGTVFFNTVKDKANILLKNCNEFIKSKKPVVQEILKEKKNRNKVLIAVVCVNGFSQLSAGRTKQTTTRYAGARQKLYKKSPI